MCLDAVVTVVDALNIGSQLVSPREEGAINEAQLQVAYADIILLNKVSNLLQIWDLQCTSTEHATYT